MFCGTTRKQAEILPEQQWSAISLKDFHTKSVFTYIAYGYLYFSILLSLAVYGVDIFTAVELLVFNNWASSIKPTQLLTFDQAKWIFAIAILASFVNLAFEHIRAWRVMRRQSVAECYLDNLAVRLESTRFGQGQGFRRFLVFAALTKSKKGAEYVALFTYFSFQSWIRVIFLSGPRQAVNALTLLAVFKSDLIPTDNSSIGSTFSSFFAKLQALANENTQQVVILSGMLFTLVIWIFSVLFLLAGGLFYIFFLWHYIPRQDGGLHGYCERKVNKRLMKIVTKKVNKALAKEERDRVKAEAKAAKKLGDAMPTERQATLPAFLDAEKGDKLAEMPMLGRTETMATLPVYSSRPGTPGSIELGAMDLPRPSPLRQGTNGSNMSIPSYSSRAPLVAEAAGMGYSRSNSPEPTIPNLEMGDYPSSPRSRSNRGPAPGSLQTNDNGFAGWYGGSNPPLRSPDHVLSPASTVDGFGMNRTEPPARPQYNEGLSRPAPSAYSSRSPAIRPPYQDGRSSPASSVSSNRGPNGPSYPPPLRSTTSLPMPSPQRRAPPLRNMTAPTPTFQGDYFPGGQGNGSSPRGYNGYNGYN
ncbi:hypothetical protein F5Y16DRAFT_390659 [Xylariaceae sp. FL0255]|nr:hypothetical protein F5Y16DRAFT_390659 [Xylariaceae sp. FL0255]